MVGGAITHESGVIGYRELVVDIKWGLVSKVDALKKHAFPGFECEEVVGPCLTKDNGLFAGAWREEKAPSIAALLTVDWNRVRRGFRDNRTGGEFVDTWADLFADFELGSEGAVDAVC
jgi:hypothetical protein